VPGGLLRLTQRSSYRHPLHRTGIRAVQADGKTQGRVSCDQSFNGRYPRPGAGEPGEWPAEAGTDQVQAEGAE
jgi:hypothetical protein